MVSFGGINQGGRTLRSTWEMITAPTPLLEYQITGERLVLAGQTPVGVFPGVTWRRNGVPIAAGGRVSIETTGQTGRLILVIANPVAADAGAYSATVSTVGCGTLTTNAVQVVVPSTCPADFNADGDLDPDDLSDYIACYFTPGGVCNQADVTATGTSIPMTFPTSSARISLVAELTDSINEETGACGRTHWLSRRWAGGA